MKRKIALLIALLTLLSLFPSCSPSAGSGEETELPAALIDPDEGRVIVSGKADEVYVPSITASAAAGIYNEGDRPESVVLTTDSGYVIRYTTSTCVVPGALSSSADRAIRLSYKNTGDGVSECAIVRAALFDGSEQVAPCQTFTYFSAPEGRFSTPVFSLVSEPEGLYSDETGILVEGKARRDALRYGNPKGWVLGNTNANFYNSGIEWERAVSIEFSESGLGPYDFSENGGMRVNGGWTRANRQKSLKLFSRRIYTPDMGTFAIDLFPGYRDPHTGRTLSFANTILIRGGSNNEGNNVIATPVQLKLCEGTSQYLPAMRPVTQFINGEYRGVLMLLEDYDADYFEAHLGIPEEELTILSGSYENYGGSMWTVDTGTDDELTDFLKTLHKLSNLNAASAAEYAQAEKVLDLRSFIEYMCIELYCGNSDWPDNNLRAFRRKADGYVSNAQGVYDGRWRFLLKDLDLSFGNGHSVGKDPYHTIEGQSALLIRGVFNNLMKNQTFANRVYMYFCTLATAIFKPARVQSVISDISLAMSAEMKYTTKALGIAGGSINTWQTNLFGLSSYASRRVTNVLTDTERECGKSLSSLSVSITGEGEAELGWFAAEDGEVRQYPRSLVIPLELSADADVTVEGGIWSADSESIILTGDSAALTIGFKPAEPPKESDTSSPVVINEAAVRGTTTPFIELYNRTDEDIRLDGWKIVTKREQILDGMTIPAHGYLTLGEGFDLPIRFGTGQDKTLVLYQNGIPMDSLPLGTIHRSVAQGRYPDGREVITLYHAELTPGAPNAILPAFEIDFDYLKNAVVICGTVKDIEVTLNENTLIPLSMFKTPFRYSRDIYRTEYEWIKEHESEKMTVAEIIDYFSSSSVTVRFFPERNLLVIQ